MMKQMLTIIVYNRFSFTPFQKLPALTGGQKSISRHNAYINVLSCRFATTEWLRVSGESYHYHKLYVY